MRRISSDDTGGSAAAASALRAEQSRMRVIAENIANADSTAKTPGGDPYQRQVPIFQPVEVGGATGVAMIGVQADAAPFQMRYDPSHPAADKDGYVKLPNVNGLAEAMDLKAAQRAYQANLDMLDTLGSMDKRLLDLIKK